MLNFRYHVISIVAIFLGIALGIAVGVGLSPSVDSGLTTQAAVDRDQVNQLRKQLDQQSRVNTYSEAWSTHVDSASTSEVLARQRIAIVTLAGAPTNVTDGLEAAIRQAGGSVSTRLSVEDSAISNSATPASQLLPATAAAALGLDEAATPAEQLGDVLGALLSQKNVASTLDRPAVAKALDEGGLANLSSYDPNNLADVVLVVASAKSAPAESSAARDSHVQLVNGMAGKTDVVVAGPNSGGLAGSDLESIRAGAPTGVRMSTVDTADLASGQRVTILACGERLLGRVGAYGAAQGVDGPYPE